jgi:hypothetical protein
MTTTTAAPGLAARAVHAARAHRAADPHGYRRRHDDPDQWIRWTRRARAARAIAAALQVPVETVFVTDDPRRAYGAGSVPGDLITVTDPPTGRAWQFIPDLTTTPHGGWLLLERCLDCGTDVPAARIACLTDLGDHLDPDTDRRLPDDARDAHRPGCALAPPTD